MPTNHLILTQTGLLVVSGKKLLEVKSLRKSYGSKEVVSEVSFEVNEAEIYGLLGPNGAGKTTTFRMAMGQLKPDGGRVFFKGQDVTKCTMYQRARLGIGYLAQEPSIFTGLSVEDNIKAILEYEEKDKKKHKKTLDELLELLDLTDLRRQNAASLSGGQRRRLEVTRALVTKPKLLMLDEPFAGISPKAVHDIKDILRNLVTTREISILITDHNVYETLNLVDRAAILVEGKLEVQGTPQEIASNEEARRLYLGENFRLIND
jgi:lipopolysaccharide export system ATP-binding protein